MRVRAFVWKEPSIALVTAVEFCFSTPRIDMHRWAHLAHHRDTGRVDRGANRLGDLVRHALLDLEPPANTSTSRGILLRPTTRPLGM